MFFVLMFLHPVEELVSQLSISIRWGKHCANFITPSALLNFVLGGGGGGGAPNFSITRGTSLSWNSPSNLNSNLSAFSKTNLASRTVRLGFQGTIFRNVNRRYDRGLGGWWDFLANSESFPWKKPTPTWREGIRLTSQLPFWHHHRHRWPVEHSD